MLVHTNFGSFYDGNSGLQAVSFHDLPRYSELGSFGKNTSATRAGKWAGLWSLFQRQTLPKQPREQRAQVSLEQQGIKEDKTEPDAKPQRRERPEVNAVERVGAFADIPQLFDGRT
jgi:hypothetical protein